MYEVRLIQDDYDTHLYSHREKVDALKSMRTTLTYYQRKHSCSFIESILGKGFFNRVGFRLIDGRYSGVMGEKPIILEVRIKETNEE